MHSLYQQLVNSDVAVDCCTLSSEARRQLWSQHYDGIAIDLLMADRDGISLALELREEHPRLPVLVISTTDTRPRLDAGPEWLNRSTEYARLVFALKQAGQRTAGRPPNILHVEEDDKLARLVQNTIGNQTNLFRARSAKEAQIAMALRSYDLALVRTPPATEAPLQQSDNKPLLVSTDNRSNPLLTILSQLRPPSFIHQPAYC